MPTSETMSEGSHMPPDDGSQKTVMLSPDMMPDGMTPKDGDKLTFCVMGEPTADGVPGYFESASKPAEGDGGQDWEAEARKALSPRDGDSNDAM